MKRILITGCDRGIGREFAIQFAREGWEVWATYYDLANRLDSQTAEGHFHHFQLDVTNPAHFSQVKKALGRRPLEVLISNAGIGLERATFGAIDYEYVERMYLTNSIGPLRLIETFVDNVAASKLRRFIAISSRMGSIGLNLTGAHYGYRASKAALNAMLRSLAIDLCPRKICVVALHPGAVAVAGEPDMPLRVEDSVANMRKIIVGLSMHESGQFYRHDGVPLPW